MSDSFSMSEGGPDALDPGATRLIDLTLERHDQAWVLAVVGDLDMVTAPLLSRDLASALARASGPVVVDLSEVSFLGSAGLAVLLDAHQRARSNTTLRVVATQRVVLRPIQITGMDAVLAVYPSRADALR